LFQDDKVLETHQKAKHFKCNICDKKQFTSAGGLVVHMWNSHKQNINTIANSKPGRETISADILRNIIDVEGGEYKRQKTEDDIMAAPHTFAPSNFLPMGQVGFGAPPFGGPMGFRGGPPPFRGGPVPMLGQPGPQGAIGGPQGMNQEGQPRGGQIGGPIRPNGPMGGPNNGPHMGMPMGPNGPIGVPLLMRGAPMPIGGPMPMGPNGPMGPGGPMGGPIGPNGPMGSPMGPNGPIGGQMGPNGPNGPMGSPMGPNGPMGFRGGLNVPNNGNSLPFGQRPGPLFPINFQAKEEQQELNPLISQRAVLENEGNQKFHLIYDEIDISMEEKRARQQQYAFNIQFQR